MNYFVDHWGEPQVANFDKFFRTRFPCLVYGTPEYWQDHATHCYYCDIKFESKQNATVDHFYPVSKDSPNNKEKYLRLFVICCEKCNTHKTNLHPLEFIRKFTKLNKIGLGIKKFTPQAIKTISERVNEIHNDVIFGRKKRIYYKNHSQSIPSNFVKINTPKPN
jgi:hypothetical protein